MILTRAGGLLSTASLVLVSLCVLMTTNPIAIATAAVGSLDQFAQDVADEACPYAMLHSYGCPINQSQAAILRRQQQAADEVMMYTLKQQAQAPLASAGNSGGSSGGDAAAPQSCGVKVGGSCDSDTPVEKKWSIGSVPVGVGFDTVSMSVKLPVFYPKGEAAYVFDVSFQNQSYSNIEDYLHSMSPENVQALMTGTLSTDVNHVYNTFFGSYSYMHRTTQVDIITKATLTDAPTPLPRVQATFDYLPEEYNEEIYSEFIRYWGTHVVTEAAIGGACEQLVSVKSCFASGNAVMIANNAQLELAQKTLQSPTGSKLNQAYSKFTSETQVKMYGGNIEYSMPSDWKKREKSIAQAPVLIKVDKMVPISSYLTNAAKKANLENAVSAYIAKAKASRAAAVAAAKAAQTFKVQASTTLEYDSVRFTFGYQYKHCCSHFWHWCTGHCCSGATACFTPGTCSTGCGSPITGSVIVADFPTTSLKRGETATMSPDGKKSCACSSYSGYQTPTFPLNNIEQNFKCTINQNGEVVASAVVNPGYKEFLVSGTATPTDGQPVARGCSVASITYTGSVWRVTGGSGHGCGAQTGDLSQSGTITAHGHCCIDTTLVPTYENSGACLGSLSQGSCPGFNG